MAAGSQWNTELGNLAPDLMSCGVTFPSKFFAQASLTALRTVGNPYTRGLHQWMLGGGKETVSVGSTLC